MVTHCLDGKKRGEEGKEKKEEREKEKKKVDTTNNK
jgi:hypothetical protein